MLERFTGDARGVVTGAREGALRLGHDWIGCEHLLLALTATGGEVGTILRDQGITPDRVRWETVRLAGAGRGASLFDVLDRDALASIGIDLDAVRGKVEAAFGPGAFTAAPSRPSCRRWAHPARGCAPRSSAVTDRPADGAVGCPWRPAGGEPGRWCAPDGDGERGGRKATGRWSSSRPARWGPMWRSPTFWWWRTWPGPVTSG
jgi:Clp amino terminal domain, pathogenicity island component